MRLPDTAAQTIPITVTGGDAVEGVNVSVMIADGFPEAPGSSINAPDISSLDLVAGTIFATNNTGQHVDKTAQVAKTGFVVTKRKHRGRRWPALGTLTITSVGAPAGSFPLVLSSPALDNYAGPTNFVSFTPTIINGTLITNGTINAPINTTFTTGPFTTAAGTVASKTGAGILLVNGPQTHAAGAVLNINAGSAVFNTDARQPPRAKISHST